MTTGAEWAERAQAVIPNGMYGHQLVALLPDGYPQFFSKAKGATLWDADGKAYLDYMCGYGPNLFGYGHEAIDQAYIDQLRQGDTMTGPSTVMVELAETLTGMISHADWAMFCKNGTDANSMAMMTARAHTGKKAILMAKGAYHGAAPWSTPLKSGTTPEDRANQFFYDYNNVESLERAVKACAGDLAAIFASPIRHDAFVDQEQPDPAYAQRARALCDEHGALLILDEVRCGFRLSRDCSWSAVGVEPDLSSWGKGVANGHPLSLLLGSNKARAAVASIYVTGSFWFSAAPMAASLTTLRLIRESDYLEHTIALGDRLRAGLGEVAGRHGYGLRQTGPSQLPLILFTDDPEFKLGYAWNAGMMERGFYLHPWHNMFICNAMTEADIDRTIAAADEVFADMRKDLRPAGAEKLLFLKGLL